jgi:hypothetical protein
MRFIWARPQTLFACTALALCCGIAVSYAATGKKGWTIQRTPNPSGAASSYLSGVACPASHSCLAVGYWSAFLPVGTPLIERWNGRAWKIQTPAKPTGAAHTETESISCTSPRACVAVGYFDTSSGRPMTLAEHWNGRRWTVKATPNPSSAASSFLTSVSCASRRDCVAVGYSNSTPSGGSPLAERWNGRAWKIQRTPTPTGAAATELFGVSCGTAGRCEAVGRWRKASGPEMTIALGLKGKRWSVQQSGNGAGVFDNVLEDVSCVSPRACIAVGSSTGSSTEIPLAEHWDGRHWKLQRVSTPAGAVTGYLSGVSCPSPGACTAVGYWTSHLPLHGAILAERWNGKHWATQGAPSPPGATHSYLEAVSCSSVKLCTGVGDFTPSTIGELSLAERWRR